MAWAPTGTHQDIVSEGILQELGVECGRGLYERLHHLETHPYRALHALDAWGRYAYVCVVSAIILKHLHDDITFCKAVLHVAGFHTGFFFWGGGGGNPRARPPPPPSV